MKKIILGFLVVLSLACVLSGCGVKSSLDRPDPSYPRAYPVH
ncbi:MAG: lipoprotein [Alphaproteobacteria bacterium]|nr:lipoprotein [Alphaproteobacteria bacterium]